MNRVNNAAAPYRNGMHTEPKPPNPVGDRVELSEHAQLVARLQALPEVRLELVDQARKAIDDPGYLTDERLNAAIELLLEDINADDDLL